jgi:predicted metal-dependent enzyme (double-stranded beta helix superfamily)
MPLTLSTFAADIRRVLQEDAGPAGREQVAALLRDALQDRVFVESLFDADSPERRIVHEDPQLGFCILAHRYTDARQGGPHDHGPSWAIYGQADGDTVMSDWSVVQPGQVKKLREYTMAPGSVHVYNEGAIHAPARSGPNRLVRIEGTNLERVRRGGYRPVPERGTS